MQISLWMDHNCQGIREHIKTIRHTPRTSPKPDPRRTIQGSVICQSMLSQNRAQWLPAKFTGDVYLFWAGWSVGRFWAGSWAGFWRGGRWRAAGMHFKTLARQDVDKVLGYRAGRNNAMAK